MRSNQGGFVFGAMRIKKIQALVHWVKDTKLRGLTLDPNDFNVVIMNKHMDLLQIGDSTTDESEVKPPPTLRRKNRFNGNYCLVIILCR